MNKFATVMAVLALSAATAQAENPGGEHSKERR